MKLLKTAFLGLAILVSGSAFAEQSFTAHGRVIHSTPVYKTIEVVCRDHHNNHQSHSGYSNSGHYRDKQHTRTFSTANINTHKSAAKHSKHKDRAIKNKHNRHQQYEHFEGGRHYKTKRILKGFDVTYRYNGNTFHTFTKHRPGRQISLYISISPQF